MLSARSKAVCCSVLQCVAVCCSVCTYIVCIHICDITCIHIMYTHVKPTGMLSARSKAAGVCCSKSVGALSFKPVGDFSVSRSFFTYVGQFSIYGGHFSYIWVIFHICWSFFKYVAPAPLPSSLWATFLLAGHFLYM